MSGPKQNIHLNQNTKFAPPTMCYTRRTTIDTSLATPNQQTNRQTIAMPWSHTTRQRTTNVTWYWSPYHQQQQQQQQHVCVYSVRLTSMNNFATRNILAHVVITRGSYSG